LVNFKVDSEVVSQKKVEEKLTLTITTNGAVKPKNALQEVLELSKNSFDKISGLISDEEKEK
jgi:DNA-directed RNA polymerase alpha subunit